MAALATTSSLNNYPRLGISRYRDQLRKSGKASSVDLNYSYRGKAYRYSIQLTTTAPHYGGLRYFWLCPSCSKRVSVLYCAGTYVCRHCLSVPYGSQLQTKTDRIYSKLNALRDRLGWSVGIINGIGSKPRYMHHSTYERLINEYERLEQKLIRTFY